MTEQEVFILAEQTLAKVVDQVKDDQWDLKLPEWFQLGGTQDRDKITLKTIINYHAYDTAWVPDVLAGKTAEEVGTKYDGDLLDDDPKGSYQNFSNKAVEAVKSLDDPDKIVHISYGDFPAKEYLKHITSFRGFRAYDIAKLIGANTKLPGDLVQGLWDEVEPEVEGWRQMGVYGPEVKVPEDADLQTKLLGMVGREA